ncbi:hypothetical protein [Aeromonas veronii]|uniref:hypothetical protein n=1 Tax=Aeromonas veronii TaxID=654 RepID=UPI00226C7CC0|nr:hypothetical protein [Aeromonas veronii]MCX9103775.1 hypothetical protein [Aeromonas veronii]MCX9119426.1 hypothetical protein [Aeromonas veronii]
MSAIKKFDHPKELLYKLHREGRRANLSNNETDILDAVFNFCVTGHSLRDWIVKYLQLNESQKNKFHSDCNKNNYLKYCRDIANSSKHFGLDFSKQSTVSSVNTKEVEFSSIYAPGNEIQNSTVNKVTAQIEVAHDDTLHLIMFVHFVAKAYKDIFKTHHIEFDESLTNSAFLAGGHYQ